MKLSGIYKIQSKINSERIYIGSSVELQRRFRLHIWDLKRGKHKNIKLQRHFNKYGEDDLIFSIIAYCNNNELLLFEQFYIDAYNPYFNICLNAGNTLGVKKSDECKRKISEANKGKKRSKEVLEKISKCFKGRKNTWAIGNKNCLGRKISEETRDKLRKSHLGQITWMKGKHHTEEAKEKNRKAHLGKRKKRDTI